MAGTSDIEIDLYAVVDRLLLLKADLQAYRSARDPQDVRREQIAFTIRQVSERAVALEDLAMRIGASVVVVTAGSATAESLRCALHRFDRLDSIDDAEPCDEVVSSVIDALHVADVVSLRAAGGRSDLATVRQDVRVERLAWSDGSRPGVVVARIGPPPPSAAASDDDRAARSVGS
jgi:hypothetical protein